LYLKLYLLSAPLLCTGAFLFSSSNLENNNTFLCSYSFGDSWLIGKTKEGKPSPSTLEENSTLHQKTPVHSKEGALCEFIREECLIRLGAKSIFEYSENNTISLSKGSMLIGLKESENITIQSEYSRLQIKGRFTAIVECTSNGGFKFIPLEGKGQIIPERGEPKDIFRGRLTMVLGSPSKLGNAYDIDLLLLLKSSRLINSFPTPLPSMKRISLSIYAQQLRLKGKFNALIGDAPTDDNLQMWAFGEEDTK
jgi:hypothetical protein